jgi:hypothetical protein
MVRINIVKQISGSGFYVIIHFLNKMLKKMIGLECKAKPEALKVEN